jgi:hypothetical protein
MRQNEEIGRTTYQFDPTHDPRWSDLVDRHPRASVFHTVPWLEALRQTYDYEPVAFTTSPPDSELKNGLVFCHIRSWLTGSRLVSLPFSDHCDPLCDSPEDLNALIRGLQTALQDRKWGYLELRPANGNFSQTGDATGLLPIAKHFLHTLSLRPALNELFEALDKDSVQRRIQRAERAGLVEKCGNSKDLLKDFYALFVVTRRRHSLPPIPYAWFRNLIQSQREALEIRLAYKDKVPTAAILTLRFKDILYYKYGCSDARFNKYGAIPWLLWKAVTDGKSHGATEFDMGRTEQEHTGLLAFKNHWTKSRKQLVYWRFPRVTAIDSTENWKLRLAKPVFSCMPKSLLTITGRLVYRHIG